MVDGQIHADTLNGNRAHRSSGKAQHIVICQARMSRCSRIDRIGASISCIATNTASFAITVCSLSTSTIRSIHTRSATGHRINPTNNRLARRSQRTVICLGLAQHSQSLTARLGFGGERNTIHFTPMIDIAHHSYARYASNQQCRQNKAHHTLEKHPPATPLFAAHTGVCLLITHDVIHGIFAPFASRIKPSSHLSRCVERTRDFRMPDSPMLAKAKATTITAPMPIPPVSGSWATVLALATRYRALPAV